MADTEVVSLLSKWRHGNVKVWDYRLTHSRLTFRVQSKNLLGNLHIFCTGTTYMKGSFSWEDCNLEIVRDFVNKDQNTTILRDSKADFELHCLVVFVEENVEPVYDSDLGFDGSCAKMS